MSSIVGSIEAQRGQPGAEYRCGGGREVLILPGTATRPAGFHYGRREGEANWIWLVDAKNLEQFFAGDDEVEVYT
jgi:hypothetical protein